MSSGWAAPVLAVVGGLFLLGTTTADWVVQPTARSVGGADGVEIAGRVAVTGAETVPYLLLVGLGLVLVGLVTGFARGVVRRALGGVLAALGAAGVVLWAVGLLRTRQVEGALQTTAFLPVAGAALGLVAGLEAGRGPARAASLPARFRIDDADAAVGDAGAQGADPGSGSTPSAAPGPGGRPEHPDDIAAAEWDQAVAEDPR